MSLENTIITKKRTPIILILVSIFLIIITVYDCFSWMGDKNRDAIYWMRPVPMIIYTIFWILGTFLKKIGAFGFIFLTIIHFSLFILIPKMEWDIGRWELVIIDNFMVTPIPVNIALSVLMLLHLKRMK